MRVLLVEDDPRISSFVGRGLKENGYVVDHAADGDTGLRMAQQEESFDVIILDQVLPKRTGLSLLKELRKTRRTPVLMLTAMDSVQDRVRGLDAGADDYLVKPFALAELLARLRTILRRGTDAGSAVLAFGGIEMDLVKRSVIHDGNPVELTAREFSLLEYFLRNPGQPLSRSMIMEHVWDSQFDGFSNVIDVHVNRLRKKLGEPDPEQSVLRAVKGVGYVLAAPQ